LDSLTKKPNYYGKHYNA